MAPDTLIPILILATYFFMLITERMWPARQFPRTRWWVALGVGFLVVTAGLNAVIPSLLPMDWIMAHSLLPGYRLGIAGGILIGYPLVALFTAMSHRLCHHFNFLWRWVHQIHHAPERVDIPGSVLFHPFDIVQNVLVSVFATVFILGLHPVAGAWVGYVQIFYGLFQHWNVRTPAGLGYIIQRPESHCVHHQRDLHAYNYSDFPLWDIVMGTFKNPAGWQGDAGFLPDRSRKYGAMLLGRDVNPALENGGGGKIA
jgi:sterol desaturase/sphingolipid hydroxylase (fatty acid hydroxylase superfamily)